MSIAKKLGLSTKLAITVFGVLLFSISMCSLLNYVNFEKNYHEIVDSRFSALLENLRNRVEYGLNLGLSLDGMKNVQSLIDDAKKADSDIAFITVVNNQGDSLFMAGEHADMDMSNLDNDLFISKSVEVKNNFGQSEGQLILAYKKEVIAVAERRTQMKLIMDASVMLGVFGLLGAIFMRASMRSLINSLKYMETSLRNILNGQPDAQIDKTAKRAELEKEFDLFHDSYKSIDNEISDLLFSSDVPTKGVKPVAQGPVNE